MMRRPIWCASSSTTKKWVSLDDTRKNTYISKRWRRNPSNIYDPPIHPDRRQVSAVSLYIIRDIASPVRIAMVKLARVPINTYSVVRISFALFNSPKRNTDFYNFSTIFFVIFSLINRIFFAVVNFCLSATNPNCKIPRMFQFKSHIFCGIE